MEDRVVLALQYGGGKSDNKKGKTAGPKSTGGLFNPIYHCIKTWRIRIVGKEPDKNPLACHTSRFNQHISDFIL